MNLDELFIKKATKVHGSKYDYSKIEYINNRTKVIIICPTHGEFKQRPTNHLAGRECQKCGIVKSQESLRKTLNVFLNEAKEKHGSKYDYTEVKYVNTDTKVTIICSEHGKFKQTPARHITGCGCPKCAEDFRNKNLAIGFNEVSNMASKMHSNKFLYPEQECKNLHQKISIVCPTHGEFKQVARHHVGGCGCPKCSISKPHNEVLKILNKMEVPHEVNDRNQIHPLELDIFIPNSKIAIEINGCFWHGSNNLSRKLRHQHKHKECLKKEIFLIQFWDYEIYERPELIESILRSKLKKSTKIIGARKCKLLEVSKTESQKFLVKNHIQKFRHAKHTIGLTYNNELVALSSFSKHSKHEYEIIRTAYQKNITIIGGFQKMLQKFVNHTNATKIVTYADARYSTGHSYINAGFKVIGLTKPNYFYVKSNTILTRQKCQKHKLKKLLKENFKESHSETQNMFLNGYKIVHDAGHYKLLWER